MNLLPSNAVKIEIEGTTVDFFEYKENGVHYYYFDTSMTAAPEPMINAMAGLGLLDATNKKLIMINHRVPGGLFGKVNQNFTHEIEELEDGRAKVVFSYLEDESEKADLTQTSCG